MPITVIIELDYYNATAHNLTMDITNPNTAKISTIPHPISMGWEDGVIEVTHSAER
jgi:hypothetical protein